MSNDSILLLALFIDALFGDPQFLYRRLPHPIVVLGRWIEHGERWLNRGPYQRQIAAGGMLAIGIILLAGVIGWGITAVLGLIPAGWVGQALCASTLFAWRGLYDHVQAVGVALGQELGAGRQAVSQIVGRNTQSLDEAGVVRAALESAAENFSDGVIAPAFWFAMLGLPGLCMYKAINTLDSMIGYRNERYEAFGKAAARIDDCANWLPARLTGLLFVMAALSLPQADGRRAWQTMWRDAPKHRSPNAGWPESALAGALGFALGGPRCYGKQHVEGLWLGEGRTDLQPADIRAALQLYWTASVLLVIVIAVAGKLA